MIEKETNIQTSSEERKPKKSRLIWYASVLILLLVLLYFSLNGWVIQSTSEHIYREVATIPAENVGLVLGTSRWVAVGQENLFFKNRIEAAVKLFKAGKIKHILVSGDNAAQDYNEPLAMKKALEARGIPSKNIILDYAGFRTLDSVIRAKKVFGQTKLIIISQRFHLYRALFLASGYGIQASGFEAKAVTTEEAKSIHWREELARVLAVLDLYILNTQPRFLGEPVTIEG